MRRLLSFFQSSGTKFFGWLRATKKLYRILVIGLLLMLIVLAVWGIASIKLPDLPSWFWPLTLLCGLALVIVWWFTKGIHWYDRRRFLQASHGDLSAENSVDEAECVKALEASLREARGVLLRSPKIEAGNSPLYRVPWILFLGGDPEDQDGLLRAATSISPFPAPSRVVSETQYWGWWFYKNMIAIQTSTRIVCDPSERQPRGIWYHALQLLYQYRPKLPLNGLVILVSADKLLSDPESLRNYSLSLRRLVDEAMEQLQVNAPIYLVVSKLESLPGFYATCKGLPEGVRDQVLGERIDLAPQPGANPWDDIGTTFDSIRIRFHTIRLSLLKSEADPSKRKQIFEFVDSFGRLREGIVSVSRILLENNPFQHNPKLRGVYFAATGAEPAFINDLFSRFLPTDQPLAERRQQWKLGKWLRALVGIGCVAALSLALTTFILTATSRDKALLAAVQSACGMGADLALPQPELGTLIRCHNSLSKIEQESHDRGLSFGLHAHKPVLDQRKKAFAQAFSRSFLEPYDEQFNNSIAQGQTGFGHYLSVVERLSAIRACGDSAVKCNPGNLDVRFVFDRLQSRLPKAENDSLIRAYLSYVLWEGSTARQIESTQLMASLEKMSQAHPFTPQDLVAWASSNFPGYTVERLWRPPREHNTQEPSVAVEAAYTQTVSLGILPAFKTQLQESAPNLTSLYQSFSKDYWQNYFQRWGAFLGNFHSGVMLWKGSYDQLISQMARGESPYNELRNALEQNIFNLPLATPISTRLSLYFNDVKNDWTSFFSLTGKHFKKMWSELGQANRVASPTWVLTVEEKLASDGKKASILFDQMIHTLDQDKKGQESYKIAAEIFKSNGAASTGPAQNFSKLDQLIGQPPESVVPKMTPEDHAAWSGLHGPSRVLLILITYRAGQFLQAQWNTSIVEPMQRLNASERNSVFLSDNGKINAFINDWLKPFVNEKEKTPIQVMDVSLPFAGGYRKVIDTISQIAPLASSKDPFFAGTFRFTQASRMGKVTEGPQGTELSLSCRGNKTIVSTLGGSLSERTSKIYWAPDSCDEIRIRVALPLPVDTVTAANAAPAVASLTKTYTGRNGFIQLVNDFKQGTRTFSLQEFKPSYTASEWAELLKHLTPFGITSVKIFLEIQKSNELEQYMSASRNTGGIPTLLME